MPLSKTFLLFVLFFSFSGCPMLLYLIIFYVFIISTLDYSNSAAFFVSEVDLSKSCTLGLITDSLQSFVSHFDLYHIDGTTVIFRVQHVYVFSISFDLTLILLEFFHSQSFVLLNMLITTVFFISNSILIGSSFFYKLLHEGSCQLLL